MKIYSKVKTPDGVGTVIQISCLRSNGLYFEPECTEVIVWYGTENAANGWVQRTYRLDECVVITS